ncbi:glycosyltransferase [Ramlibacter terrae]|uniref:Glycosyltransferase n=1 Tax=Ramlibacter terrae TaxID=2732511 RepID=A0ABX6P453_9BURK|nr:glycosyltransferase [Ramlibacter terrae]
MNQRAGRGHALLSAVPSVLLFGGAALLFLLWGRDVLHGMHAEVVVAFSLFALWRYGWQLTHYLRAGWYAGWHYPRLRAAAQEAAAGRSWPARIFVVVPSYLEEPRVSTSAMQALLANPAELPCHATVVVAVGSADDEALIAAACRGHVALRKVELVFQRQSQGKRIALGHALRAVARRYQHEPDSVTVFMDGDSWLEPGALARTMPFFMAYRDLGAVTTNEEVYLPAGGAWYRDWFRLKFGQRRVLFQSHSLSHKVLTLTGRFSVFRTSIVVSEDFLALIENDTIDHWLHGRFRFLMGDDKSSWFHVLRSGWNMLYLPDVTCVSLESRDESFLSASLSLPYRWFGNTLRNNPRALALGPGHTGWFIWLVLLDQRLSMWTSLVGITGATVLAITKSALYLPIYIAWAVLVRSTQLLVIAWHGHDVTLRTIPIMLYTQWVGALVKIRAWHHRPTRSGARAAPAGHRHRGLGAAGAHRTHAGRVPAFALVVLLGHSALRLPGTELFAAQRNAQAPAAPSGVTLVAAEAPAPAGALAPGVRADDGADDAAALQALLDAAPPGPLTLRLPAGQLDFQQPVVIRRDGVTLIGAGADRTRIVSRVRNPDSAVIRVEGAPGPRLGGLARGAGEQDRELQVSGKAPPAGSLLWLRQPNDERFFRAIGSEQWRREFPYLRQALVQVGAVAGNVARIAAPTGVGFDADGTRWCW